MENSDVAVLEQPLLKQALAKTNTKEIGVKLLEELTAGFSPFFEEAQKLLKEAEAIQVISEDQEDDMKKARETRLALVKVRTGADKKREELKKNAMTYANAVQGMFNILQLTVKPTEDRLQEAEKFKEMMQAKREAELQTARIKALTPYLEFVPQTDNLGKLTTEQYEKVYKGAQLQYEAHQRELAEAEEKRKAEEERMEKERMEKEKARQKELAEAKKKAEEAEKLRKHIEAKQAEERKLAEAKLAEERKLAEAKLAEERKLAEAKLAEERKKAQEEIAKAKAETDKIKQSVAFVKAHKPEPTESTPKTAPANDKEAWARIDELLNEAKYLTFTSKTSQELHKKVIGLLNKVLIYIHENKPQQ